MTEIATFGAGCFWGIEAAFRRVPGVIDAVVGYSGGPTQNPTYKGVCTDETGHPEDLPVTSDPATQAVISKVLNCGAAGESVCHTILAGKHRNFLSAIIRAVP